MYLSVFAVSLDHIDLPDGWDLLVNDGNLFLFKYVGPYSPTDIENVRALTSRLESSPLIIKAKLLYI